MLYPQLLQRDFENLPRALRAFHSAPGGGVASGTVDVHRENRWLAALLGFPPAGEGIAMRLRVIASGDVEIWTRQFGQAVLRSFQQRKGNLLVESVGPVRVFFRVFADQNGMRFRSQRARLWIFPFPLRVDAQAWGGETSWEFQVKVACVGSYRGEVVPAV